MRSSGEVIKAFPHTETCRASLGGRERRDRCWCTAASVTVVTKSRYAHASVLLRRAVDDGGFFPTPTSAAEVE